MSIIIPFMLLITNLLFFFPQFAQASDTMTQFQSLIDGKTLVPKMEALSLVSSLQVVRIGVMSEYGTKIYHFELLFGLPTVRTLAKIIPAC